MPTMGGAKTENGIWTISTDNKILSTTMENKTKEDLTIISLDSKNLVFSFPDERVDRLP